MTLRTALLPAALICLSAVAANAAATLTLTSITGTVIIKTRDGNSITVKPGDVAPAIRAGDRVSVESGEAVFESKGIKVSADAGSQFSVRAGKGIQIASIGRTPVSITVNAQTAILKSGDTVSVLGKSLTVVEGSVSVTNAVGQTIIVPAGQTVSPAPSVTSQSTPFAPGTNDNPPAPPPPPTQEAAVAPISPSAP